MVLQPEIFGYIDGINCILEKQPLEKLATENQLKAFKHYGFWQCMDTQRDKTMLDNLWESGNSPWKIW